VKGNADRHVPVQLENNGQQMGILTLSVWIGHSCPTPLIWCGAGALARERLYQCTASAAPPLKNVIPSVAEKLFFARDPLLTAVIRNSSDNL
jgi:hypothetical protein